MKIPARFIALLILSISPILPMENDKNSDPQRKVFCKSEYWENGKKIRENVEYVPYVREQFIRQGGMGAWEEAMQSAVVGESTLFQAYDGFW